MATMIPSAPPKALANELAKVRRALKSLPDSDYIVWQHLLRETDGFPEFMVLSKDRRCVLVKVSSATSREASTALQPELIRSQVGRQAFGESEQVAINRVFAKLGGEGAAELVPGLVVFPNVSAANLKEALHGVAKPKSEWLSRADLKPSRFRQTVEGQLGPKLSRVQLARLRVVFSPEVEIPADFTVRDRLDRGTKAQLTTYLMDYRQEWLVKSDLDLNRDARQTAMDFNVRLVNGVAGSGKSLIIVYRAKILRELFPNKRILVLTHNRPLIQDLEQRYRVLTDGDESVEWRTFYSWCYSMLPASVDLEKPLGEDRRVELISTVQRRHLADTSVTPDLLEAEIDWFKDHLITKRSEYIEADRTGRGFGLTESMRNRVFDAMQEYQEELTRRGRIDWGDVPRRLWQMINDGVVTAPAYDVILIDEAQFFAPIWFELIKRAVKTATGHLFIVADPTQGFLRRGQSWLASGLEVRGRTVRLNRSYRTTREILDFATLLYRSRIPNDDEDIVLPDLVDMPNGAVPVVVPMTSPQDEIQRVTAEIVDLVKSGVAGRDILVIHATWQGVDALIASLGKELGDDLVVDAKESGVGDRIRVCTLNAATGLESPIVFLVGLKTMQEKELSLRISEEDQTELIRDNTRKLYMAITRAGQRLVMTYCGDLPAWLQGQGGSGDKAAA